MNHFAGKMLLAACSLLALVSCEKPFIDDGTLGDGVRIGFQLAGAEDFASSTASSATGTLPLSDVCKRVNLAVYKDGARVKYVNQQVTDDGFGSIALSLPAGEYHLLILAHNGDKDATTTKIDEVTFNNNKVTDTFVYIDTLEVSEDMQKSVRMKRAVALVRFVANDNMPDNVKTMRFYYTGGSSTMDGTTGQGCKNSRQTEEREVTDEMIGQPTSFDIYTIPHGEDDKLKLTVSALDANGTVLYEKVIEEIPVRCNHITRLTGEFFTEEEKNGIATFTIEVDAGWDEQIDFSY